MSTELNKLRHELRLALETHVRTHLPTRHDDVARAVERLVDEIAANAAQHAFNDAAEYVDAQTRRFNALVARVEALEFKAPTAQADVSGRKLADYPHFAANEDNLLDASGHAPNEDSVDGQ